MPMPPMPPMPPMASIPPMPPPCEWPWPPAAVVVVLGLGRVGDERLGGQDDGGDGRGVRQAR